MLASGCAVEWWEAANGVFGFGNEGRIGITAGYIECGEKLCSMVGEGVPLGAEESIVDELAGDDV